MRRNPLVAFFVICFAVSWGLWLPLILSHTDVAELLGIIGVFGPALACIIVSRISTSSIQGPPSIPFWLSFIAGWLVSTFAFSIYNYATSTNFSPFAIVIFAVLALVPAYIIASVVSGPSGVRRTLSSLVRPGGGWGWYVLAVALPLVSQLVSVWLSKQIGWELQGEPQVASNPISLASAVVVFFLYTLIYAGGLNEETGWTGFALPRLQARLSPLVATILLWILWMLWHVPMHLSGYFNLSAHVLIGSFLGRFLMTWLFMHSSGGVLTAILLHTSVNITSQFIPLTNTSLLVDGVIALLVIVGGRMWQRLPKENSAVLAEESLTV
jgi:membrane protease YdiL (CAAX protease family)